CGTWRLLPEYWWWTSGPAMPMDGKRPFGDGRGSGSTQQALSIKDTVLTRASGRFRIILSVEYMQEMKCTLAFAVGSLSSRGSRGLKRWKKTLCGDLQTASLRIGTADSGARWRRRLST